MSTIPATIGHYTIRRRLGAGGMGAVYLGSDVALGRAVAIKVLSESFTDPSALTRFTREAQYAGTLRHPNIVTIFELGHDNGRPFIVMEYLPGETLSDLISRRAALSLHATLHIMSGICDALGYAHEKGIIHRDIKPANVLVDVDGTVKLVDFGIARRAESDLTGTGNIVGTLNYLSPEQLRGLPADARSDIFAVGATFYELVTGHRAFPGSIDDGVLTRILGDDPVPVRTIRPEVPAEIEACILRALDKSPALRYPNLAEMREAIDRLAAQLSGQGAHVSAAEELRGIVAARQPGGEPTDILQVPPPAAETRTAAGQATTSLAATARKPESRPAEAPSDTMLRPAKPRLGRAALGVAALLLTVLLITAGVFWMQRRAASVPSTPTSADAHGPVLPGPAPASAAPSATGSSTSGQPAVSPPTVGTPTPGPVRPPEPGVKTTETANAFVTSALDAYARGARDEAMTQLQSALRVDAKNTAAASVVQTWLATARGDVRTARAAAEQLGAAATSTQAFLDAQQNESTAQTIVSSRPADAIALLWTAAASYGSAAAAGRQPATSTPSSGTSSAPPPPKAPADAAVSPDAGSRPPNAGTSTTAAPPVGSNAGATTPNGSTTTPPGAVPAPPPATTIPAAARDALNRYAAAYARQDLKAIKAVFPALPSDREASLTKAFKSGCKSYDVTFDSLAPSRVTPDSLTVLATTTYTCHPSTGRAPQTVRADDVFQLKRVGENWIIEKMQLM
jgi:hypothetical protein